MPEVTETQLPGVGVLHEFSNESGERVGVLVHRSGRREILVYDRADPDVCTTILSLSHNDTRTMAELLGVSPVTEAVASVQQQVEGLSIDWLTVPPDSPMAGRSIGESELRTRTGASIVAVVRGTETVAAPDPSFRFDDGDVAVAVGTSEGLHLLRDLLRG